MPFIYDDFGRPLLISPQRQWFHDLSTFPFFNAADDQAVDAVVVVETVEEQVEPQPQPKRLKRSSAFRARRGRMCMLR